MNLNKLLLIMRLTTIILIAAIMQVSANSLAQKITLREKNAQLTEVFDKIRLQTGYDFLFTTSTLKDAGKVNIDVNNKELEEVLKDIFENQPLEFKIESKSVIVSRKETSLLSVIQSAAKNLFQSIDVTGRIVDQDGTPIPGATIRVKGTNRSVVSNASGHFAIFNVDEKALIVVSYVGFTSKELPAAKDLGEIKLLMTDSKLDEVQVIAYGTTTRRLSTSNIGSVKADAIQKQPVINPLLALQGRVPGLIISQQSGLPGAAVSVLIQGKGSLENGTDPFYVIDGVPFTSKTLQTASTIIANGSPFNYISPADIESIEILKDADATSIYGSRAANGAILITTKKGKAGKTQIKVDFQNGWGKVPKSIPMLNTVHYMAMRREAKKNDNAAISATDYDINGVWDSTRNTNWQKELIGNTALFTNLQASVSGGNNETQFLVGTTFTREGTVFMGDFSDTKGIVNFNIQHASVNRKFRMNFSGNYLVDNNKLPNTDFTAVSLSLAPNAPPLFNPDGSLNWAPVNGVTTFTNPANILVEKYRNATSNLISSMVLSYEFIPGLKLSSSFGYNKLLSDEKRLTPVAFYNPNSTFRIRNGTYFNKYIAGFIVEPQITYQRNIGKAKLDVLLGSTYQESKSDLTGINAQGFNTDLEMENIRAATTIGVAAIIKNQYRYNAGFGRINYTYKNRYVLNLTARRDGSSRFGKENRFHNFYSAGAAWIFSEETLFKNSLSFINFGKLRASYGTTGNDQIDEYRYLSLYTPVAGVGVPYQNATSLNAIGHANPFLQWELTRKFNAGLEVGVFSNRILANINYYINSSSNQLISNTLPVQTGFNTVKNNFPAVVRNYGWEISLNTTAVQRSDFGWTTNFNLTIPKNKLVSFPNLSLNPNFNSNYVIDKPITIIRAYKFSGVNEQTGLYEFIDSKGQKVSAPNPANDRTELINIASQLYGGLQNIVSYKGIELDFLFQFNKQKGQASLYRFGSFVPGVFNTNQPLSVLDRWVAGRTDAAVQKFNSTFGVISPMVNATSSDAAYTDISFIRLKNVSLSYNLPVEWLDGIKMNAVNIYVQGQNLFTITRFKGLNVESSNLGNAIPPLRVISLGLRVNI